MKKKSLPVFASLIVNASMFIVGCANNANNQMQQQGTRMQQVQDQQGQNQQAQPLGNLDNRIQIANQVEKITQIGGINQANVLVTRRNAYVAASMDTNQ